MATTKTAPAEETKTVEKTAPVSPWKQMLTIFCPKTDDNGPDYAFVCINGKTYQVPRGKQVRVPRPVYEVLSRSEHAKVITAAYDKTHKEVKANA
jgi:hypothetical protein